MTQPNKPSGAASPIVPRYECDTCGGVCIEAEMLPGDSFEEALGADLFTEYVCPHCKTMNFSLDPGHGWSLVVQPI